MRVLLSNPPWFIEGGNRWGIRAGSRWPFTLPCGSGYYPFPFLMSYAASYLRENGIEAYMVDSILTRESYNSYIKRIKEIKFDWVIMETSTPSIEHDLKLCENVSKYSKVALAGPHATSFAEELIKKPYISAILKGEYEKNSLELLRTGEEKVYEYNLTPDINTLPFPYRDYSVYNYADYFPVTPNGPQLQIWGSRGCPFKCVFCLWPPIMYKNKYRARKPSNILDEIKITLKNFPKFTSIYFDDDTFNIGKDRMMELCDGLKELKIPWAAMSRADTSDFETFKAMKDAGLYAVKFGIESGCQELVDKCKKSLSLEKVKESVAFLKSIGVWVHVTFTWGLPGETEETIERTKKFYLELRPDSAQQSCCTPFPGTKYYDMVLKQNQLKTRDWSNWDGARNSVINSTLSASELQKYAHLPVI